MQVDQDQAQNLLTVKQIEYKWAVQVPKGGNFIIQYQSDLSFWQRFWMRFIGWDVRKINTGQEHV